MTSMQAGQSNDGNRDSRGRQEAKAPDYATNIQEIIADLRKGNELTEAQVKVLESKPPTISKLLKARPEELREPPLFGLPRPGRQTRTHELRTGAAEEARLIVELEGLLPSPVKPLAIPLLLKVHYVCDRMPYLLPGDIPEEYWVDCTQVNLTRSWQSVGDRRMQLDLTLSDQSRLIKLASDPDSPPRGHFRAFTVGEVREKSFAYSPLQPRGLHSAWPKHSGATDWARQILRHVSLSPLLVDRIAQTITRRSEWAKSAFLSALRCNSEDPEKLSVLREANEARDQLNEFYDALRSRSPVCVWPDEKRHILYAVSVLIGRTRVPEDF